MISVICPTIRGREEHYHRMVAAYAANTTHRYELITVRDKPTCAEGWNEGAEQAVGDYIHFTADDLEPHPGWELPAIEAVTRGRYLPAPRIIRPDGTLDYCGFHGIDLPDMATRWDMMSVIPFMTRQQWAEIGPCLPIHYFSDNYLSWRGVQAGYQTIVRVGYQFTHHWAEEGRGAGMTYSERMEHDRKIYEEAVRAVNA